jgi:hypothetical protein
MATAGAPQTLRLEIGSSAGAGEREKKIGRPLGWLTGQADAPAHSANTPNTKYAFLSIAFSCRRDTKSIGTFVSGHREAHADCSDFGDSGLRRSLAACRQAMAFKRTLNSTT